MFFEFVPFEEVLAMLDSDGDGEISMNEWLENLDKLPGLKAAIEGAIDPASGKIRGYVSLEQRLDDLLATAAPLEAKAADVRAPTHDRRLRRFKRTRGPSTSFLPRAHTHTRTHIWRRFELTLPSVPRAFGGCVGRRGRARRRSVSPPPRFAAG